MQSASQAYRGVYYVLQTRRNVVSHFFINETVLRLPSYNVLSWCTSTVTTRYLSRAGSYRHLKIRRQYRCKTSINGPL